MTAAITELKRFGVIRFDLGSGISVDLIVTADGAQFFSVRCNSDLLSSFLCACVHRIFNLFLESCPRVNLFL